MMIKILALGDVVGPGAVQKIKSELWSIRRILGVCFTVVNGENSAETNGIDIKSAEAIIRAGADVVTTGNHVFKRREIREYLDDNKNIVRPANFPSEVNGNGYTIIDTPQGRILVMNLLGVSYMEPLACPFHTADAILKAEKGNYDISILDFHAESTSEKIAMSHYLDGRMSIVFGTHTHVQTADERVMPKGTGYITDLGMCGADNSVLGIKKEKIIEKFLTHFPVKFDIETENITLHGCIFTVDTDTGLCVKAERFER